MLTIRREQTAVFIQAGAKKFEDWMVVHLSKFFSERSQSLGEMKLRKMIQYGIKRAETHGITGQRDVCKYIDLMMVFGPDLDTDQKYPWAREIVQRPWEPEAKINALQQAAQNYLKEA